MSQTTRRRGMVSCLSVVLLCVSLPALAEEASPQEVPAEDAGEASPETPPVSEEELATARLHFRNGVDLLQQQPPNYQDAYRQFELAYDKSGGSWKVLGNLGLSALKLERDGEALHFYKEYLEKGGDEIDPGERSHIERELLLIQGNMATVDLRVSDPGARISVKRGGSAVPVQIYQLEDGAGQLGLRAGTLTIVARSGERRLTWEVTLSPEETSSHVFDFDAPEERVAEPVAAPAAAVSNDVPPEPRGLNGLQIAGIATAGVGVLTLGGGLVTGLMSQGKEKDGESECIGDVCQESARANFDSAKDLATVANVLFIGGGVLTAAGVTLIVIGGTRGKGPTEGSAELELSPFVTPTSTGLFATGRF